MPRFWEVDFCRGTAILMMAIFHFAWDLNYFGVVSAELYSGAWGVFQKATLGLFLLVAGVVIAVNAGIKKEGFVADSIRRAAWVFGCGLLVTFFTMMLFPAEFVYFGVLHLIGISILIAVPLARKKIPALLAGTAIILGPLVFNLQSIGIPALVWAGFAAPKATLDFVPLFPWFGAVLLGVFLGNALYENGKRKFEIPEWGGPLPKSVQFLGRNSLVVYLAHQGLFFPLAWLVSLLN